METKTPAIMATFGRLLFDTSSMVGLPVIFVITGLLIFVDLPDFVGFCVGFVGSVRKIDNQIIEIFAIDNPWPLINYFISWFIYNGITCL